MTINVNAVKVEHVTVNGASIEKVNANGVEVWTNAIAPGKIANLRATTNLVNKITFTWTVPTSGKPVPTYELWQGTRRIAVITRSPYSFTTTNHAAQHFVMKAVNSAGHTDNPVNGKAIVQPPSGLWENRTVSVTGTAGIMGFGPPVGKLIGLNATLNMIYNVATSTTKIIWGHGKFTGQITTISRGVPIMRLAATNNVFQLFQPNIRTKVMEKVGGTITYNPTTKQFSGSTGPTLSGVAYKADGTGLKMGIGGIGTGITAMNWSPTLRFR